MNISLEIDKVREELLSHMPKESRPKGPYKIDDSLKETLDIEQAVLAYIVTLKQKIEEQGLEMLDLKVQICILEDRLSEEGNDPDGGVSLETIREAPL